MKSKNMITIKTSLRLKTESFGTIEFIRLNKMSVFLFQKKTNKKTKTHSKLNSIFSPSCFYTWFFQIILPSCRVFLANFDSETCFILTLKIDGFNFSTVIRTFCNRMKVLCSNDSC